MQALSEKYGHKEIQTSQALIRVFGPDLMGQYADLERKIGQQKFNALRQALKVRPDDDKKKTMHEIGEILGQEDFADFTTVLKKIGYDKIGMFLSSCNLVGSATKVLRVSSEVDRIGDRHVTKGLELLVKHYI